MAAVRPRNARIPFEIHHDELDADEVINEEDHGSDESRGETQDGDGDGDSECSDESDAHVDPSVQEDMDKFQNTFKGIKERFRLINRIGEGTFSTVYKAEDLLYDHFENDWDPDKENPNLNWCSPPVKRRKTNHPYEDEDDHRQRRQEGPPKKYVAIKKIYATSSPMRILNELELLHDLQNCNSVCPLITAFRNTDQVIAILPYFRHTDFRDYFREFTTSQVRVYFRSLFTALEAVHERRIIHRDIKPTNFLYDSAKERGVLVDFGLAEKEGTECKPCLCQKDSERRRARISNSVAATMGPSNGYPKNDSRPSRRANRAGTRGFRAPEVLFKCTNQTTKLDIWSAGVILLTFLSRRFPFFNSADDVEAMIEIATIFGVQRMKSCAYLHGTVFETNIPTIGKTGFTLEKIIMWSKAVNSLSGEEKLAVAFLERCFELDPNKRISAKEALEHDFLRVDDEEEDEMEIINTPE
ncbi:Protein kinase-like (PK-like) [Venustampulla echinocandica]|uniref:non-specific serine/threonine protein kinase n=1 Tax=Venustampulla echinocandica TaxID=2656787 RepID=A0A370TC12_9HELO|nr:Protein kinase-like (PK-like) [Venustampulla echinocandica]RDL31775.1 Protein kinase-like (PK-like) [Venustampulla echinocandica]